MAHSKQDRILSSCLPHRSLLTRNFLYTTLLALLLLTMGMAAAGQASSSLTPPVIGSPLYAGENEIKGTAAALLPPGCAASVEVHDVTGGADSPLPLATDANRAVANSEFKVSLSNPLIAGRLIRVHEIFAGSCGNLPPGPLQSEAVTVSARPVISGILIEGQTEIIGSARAAIPAGFDASVEVHDVTGGSDITLTLEPGKSAAVKDGAFRAKLVLPLAADKVIRVDEVFTSTTGAAAPQFLQSSSVTVIRRPEIAGKLRDGATEINGILSFPAGCNNTNTTLEVHALSPNDQLLAQAAGAGTGSPDQKGAFTLKLKEPLQAGEWIRIDALCPKARLLSDVVGVVVPGDWGRVKSYFTSGILLSQDQNSFSQSSLFLGFTLDYAWRLPGWYHQVSLKPSNQAKAAKAQAKAKVAKHAAHEADEAAKQDPTDAKADEKATKAKADYDAAQSRADHAAAVAQQKKDRMGHWPGVNTFVEVRLTSIPVNACSTTTPTSNQASPCAPTASPTPTPSPSPTPALETFLSQRKTARFVTGAYFPWTITAWTYHNNRNGLFLGPLAKVGFDTPTGQLNQIQPAAGGTITTTNTNTVTSVNPASFYNFYGFGGRIGHYELTSPHYHDLAPELLSYLDITFGPYSNLESLVQPENPANGTNVSRKRIWRLAIEGVYKVPTTPMIVGFSANVGQEAVGVGPFNIVQRAGDDMRFVFGVKFDVAKLLDRISQISP